MKLFAFGSNGSGQLGISHEDDTNTPTQCLFEQPSDEKIITIAAGGNHTLLLTNTGTIYAAGSNADGRCGTPSPNILRFRQLQGPDPGIVFKHVSATWEGTIAASDSRIYVFGSSPKGELGLGPGTLSAVGALMPSFPPRGERIAALASGMAHSVVVLSSGEVYGWGGARKGQLGGENVGCRIAYSPVQIGVPFGAEGVVCGREFTVVWGEGRFVVLGDGGNRWGVLKVPGELALGGGMGSVCDGVGIGASWHGVYVHVPGSRAGPNGSGDELPGSLVAWGRNDRGQLPPLDLPTPMAFAVGSEHVLALLGDGRVAAFGWGEHGNCGPNTDRQGNVSGRYNVISLPGGVDGEIVGVGAGCATSWMIVA